MTDDELRTPPTLVLGSNGKIGRRVAERLAARRVPVRLGSRSARPAFDWEDRATGQSVVQGVETVLCPNYADLTIPGRSSRSRP